MPIRLLLMSHSCYLLAANSRQAESPEQLHSLVAAARCAHRLLASNVARIQLQQRFLEPGAALLTKVRQCQDRCIFLRCLTTLHSARGVVLLATAAAGAEYQKRFKCAPKRADRASLPENDLILRPARRRESVSDLAQPANSCQQNYGSHRHLLRSSRAKFIEPIYRYDSQIRSIRVVKLG